MQNQPKSIRQSMIPVTGVGTLWANIFNTLSRVYGQTLSPNPLSAIFGIPPDTNLSGALKRALALATGSQTHPAQVEAKLSSFT